MDLNKITLAGYIAYLKSMYKRYGNKEYRIKSNLEPKSECRPFKDAIECWAEMQKHQQFWWVKLKDTESGYYMLKGIAS